MTQNDKSARTCTGSRPCRLFAVTAVGTLALHAAAIGIVVLGVSVVPLFAYACTLGMMIAMDRRLCLFSLIAIGPSYWLFREALRHHTSSPLPTLADIALTMLASAVFACIVQIPKAVPSNRQVSFSLAKLLAAMAMLSFALACWMPVIRYVVGTAASTGIERTFPLLALDLSLASLVVAASLPVFYSRQESSRCHSRMLATWFVASLVATCMLIGIERGVIETSNVVLVLYVVVLATLSSLVADCAVRRSCPFP